MTDPSTDAPTDLAPGTYRIRPIATIWIMRPLRDGTVIIEVVRKDAEMIDIPQKKP